MEGPFAVQRAREKRIVQDEVLALRKRLPLRLEIREENYMKRVGWRSRLIEKCAELYKAVVDIIFYQEERFEDLDLGTRDCRYFLIGDDRLFRAIKKEDTQEIKRLLREGVSEQAYFISSTVKAADHSVIEGEPFDGLVSFRCVLRHRPQLIRTFVETSPRAISSLSVYDVGEVISQVVHYVLEDDDESALEDWLPFLFFRLKREELLKMFEKEEPLMYFAGLTLLLREFGSTAFGEKFPKKWMVKVPFRILPEEEKKEIKRLAKAYSGDISAFSRYHRYIFPYEVRKSPKKSRAL